MVLSYCCVCGSKQKFKEFLKYSNEIIFKKYEGLSLYKCTKCGVLKTFSPNKNKLNPEQSRIDLFENKQQNYQRQFEFLVSKLRKFKKSGSILDVGCSSGILLSLLNKHGYNVYGIEPNYYAYLKANQRLGDKIFHGKLEDFIKKNKLKFDFIIYNHVLEHTYNPRNEIKKALMILKKKGLIVLGLPNTANVIFFLRRKYWESLMPGEHIWHFSNKQIGKLLSDSKLKTDAIFYSNHDRRDYPFIKRIYFKFLTILGEYTGSGEAMLILASKMNK